MVTQVVMDLITDGRDAREHHGRVVDELHEKRIELERRHRQVARSWPVAKILTKHYNVPDNYALLTRYGSDARAASR